MCNRPGLAWVVAASLGVAHTAAASNPIRWQVSLGPEAVLTLSGGARSPFSTNSNPSPALRPTDLFPASIPATRRDHVLRGEVRVYFAVDGFPPGSHGGADTETAAYELTLEELKVERVEVGQSVRWQIPKAEYAELLERLRTSKVEGKRRPAAAAGPVRVELPAAGTRISYIEADAGMALLVRSADASVEARRV